MRRGAFLIGPAIALVVLASVLLDPTETSRSPDEVPLGAAMPGATWELASSADGSTATARHEAGAVAVDGKLYLMGGRGRRPLEVYDPGDRSWRDLGPPPSDLHHFQPVAIGTDIYLLGALLCCYPREPVESTVHIFDTVTETWSTGGSLPAGRERGGAGAVVRGGLIYLVGGNTLGHDGGAVPWFDVYDPKSRDWRALPDAPHARDHFAAALVGERLVAAGGRRTDQPNPFDKAVSATDVYDFTTGRWSVGAAIPTVRAGTMGVVVDGEVLVIGGESAALADAHSEVESYVVAEDRWRVLQPLPDGRHGGGAAVIGNALHVVAGSLGRGGGPETSAHETFALDADALSSPDPDSDGDGLDDAAERHVWMTDPTRADTDGDGLDDGAETGRGTDPLAADSDGDGLEDGDETGRGTDPLIADSDGDGLEDGAEIATHGTDPLVADSDGDGLGDAVEIGDHGTDPLAADSDGDGLEDGAEIDAGTDPLVADSDGDGLEDSADPPVADDSIADGDEIRDATDPPFVGSDGSSDAGDPDRQDATPGSTSGATSDPELQPETLPADDSESEPATPTRKGGGALWWLIGVLGVTWLARRRRPNP